MDAQTDGVVNLELRADALTLAVSLASFDARDDTLAEIVSVGADGQGEVLTLPESFGELDDERIAVALAETLGEVDDVRVALPQAEILGERVSLAEVLPLLETRVDALPQAEILGERVSLAEVLPLLETRVDALPQAEILGERVSLVEVLPLLETLADALPLVLSNGDSLVVIVGVIDKRIEAKALADDKGWVALTLSEGLLLPVGESDLLD